MLEILSELRNYKTCFSKRYLAVKALFYWSLYLILKISVYSFCRNFCHYNPTSVNKGTGYIDLVSQTKLVININMIFRLDQTISNHV